MIQRRDIRTSFAKSNESISSTVEIGACNLCTKQALFRCERCFDFYCNVDCQRKDWKSHRSICVRMPALIQTIANGNQTNDSALSSFNVPIDSNKKNTTNSNSLINLSIEKNNSMANNKDQENLISTHRANLENSTVKDDVKISPKLDSNQELIRQPNLLFQNKISVLSIPPETKTLTPSSMTLQKNPMTIASQNYIPYNIEKETNLNSVEFPKPGSTVVLTTVINARAVYIRPNDGDSSRKYSAIINDVEAFSKTANNLKKCPNRGDIAIANFEGNWYRVVVTKLFDETQVSIAYLDFGNLELKRYTELKECTADLANRMRYAVRANLQGLDKNARNTKAMEYLNDLVYSVIDLTIDYPMSYSEQAITEEGIKLIVTSKNENVNDTVKKLLIPEKSKHQDEFSYEDLPDYSIPVNENVEFVLLDNSYLAGNILSCAYVPDYLRLCEMNKQLQAYGDQTTEIYTPPVGKLCLAKYVEDNEWYRALCLECVGDGSPTLQFIDYGNADKVNIQNIRKIPKDFLYACPTKMCKIKDLPDKLPESMVEEIKSLISVNTTFKAVEVMKSKVEDIYWLYIPGLHNKLVN